MFDSVFRLNYSKFVNSLALKSFVKTPRPCAFKSILLQERPVEYYRGSKALIYNISEKSRYGSVLTQMNAASGGHTLIVDSTG